MCVIRSAAKVNLTLQITGKREDGYHYLKSILCPTSLTDEVELTLADDISSSIDMSGVPFQQDMELPESSDNLTTRVARALKEVSGYAGGVRIHVKKQIPIGAGLGGGSGNAAATLVGLNELWGANLSQEQLIEIGAGVGSDIPAMIVDRLVSVEGVGEQVESLENSHSAGDSGMWMVLVNPGFSVSTKDVFTRMDSALTSDSQVYKNMRFALRSGDVKLAGHNLLNDLQAVVSRKFPLVEMVLEELVAQGSLGALMSGSGATCFGLAETEAQAAEIEVGVHERFGENIWTRVVKTMPDGVMATQWVLIPSF